VFAPCAVPESFKRHYSIPHALRPSQIKAVAEEAAMLVEAAGRFSEQYKELAVPVRLIAGSDDRIVDTDQHSARLHRELGMSTFRNVPGIGHMVHHAVPDEVLAAIYALSELRRVPAARCRGVERHWLHIGEDAARGAHAEDEDEASSPRRPPAAAKGPSPLAPAATATAGGELGASP
jgi:hypothetical protein